jgi:hypothetical protein
MSSSHTWRFFRAGGSDQVALETADDLRNLRKLDQKLWVALACPVKGLELDERTLALMDGDGDGRIRAPEVIAAVEWACAMLKDPAALYAGGDLPLSSINTASEEGAQLLASAHEILKSLGKPSAASITVEDATMREMIFSQSRFNGDGVVPVENIDDAATRAVAEAIVAQVGTTLDRGGKPGITQAALDEFFAECAAFDAWWTRAEKEAATILPLGEGTAGAFSALQGVRAKIDDYFARCRLAAFDARATAALNRQESDYLTLATQRLEASSAEVAEFPLARIEAGRALPLADGLNPAWAGAMATFRAMVVTPILGDRAVLTESEWGTVQERLAAHAAWAGEAHGGKVTALGLARVREILAGPSKAALQQLLAEDAALAPAMNSLDNVERLARYQRDLARLLNNFVAFRDFYSRERASIFQVGTLYLDGRSCELCVHVDDAGKHAALAGLAKCYLAYCDCTRTNGETMTIAVAFTGGDSDNLMVGRNGIFYDRKGRDWDATITKVVENPISIQQAFWAPYKKLVRLIEEQVAKRAAAGAAAADSKIGTAATAAASVDAAKPPAEPPKKIDVGTVAALGVAFGALATAFAAIAGYATRTLALPFWQVCLVIGGLILLISTPSMLIAWLKLRQRNLGPILDANGWAVNGRVQMNVPFGGALTREATIPTGAQSSFVVKYPEPPTALPKLIAAGIAIGFMISLLNHFGVLAMLGAQ